jgi:hypothetical protein
VAEGALVGELRRLNADIARNREFLTFAASAGRFFAAVRTHRGHSRSSMVKPPRRNETNNRLLKNSGCRLLKKIQRRGTRGSMS